jgi:uncharacterized protein YvpB
MRRSRSMSMLVACFMVLSGMMTWGSTGAQAAVLTVNAWIQVSSVKPAVGCPINISVEIREKGHAVAAADVEIALHVDGNLYSADHGPTNADGIAFLALDTSSSPAGVSHWVDVNIGGKYLTGFPVIPAASGGCTENGRLIETSGDINYVKASGSNSAGPASVLVPTYQQQRNLSCEYAALHIATSAFGNGISEFAFDEVVGWSSNPHWGYRGDINGNWGNTTDYGVYAEPLSWALENFGFRGDVFYGEGDRTALTSRLDAGKPVLVWLSMWGDQSIFETVEGVTYQIVAGQHVMVAYGYDESGVYLSDPGNGTYRSFAWGYFMWMWNVLDGMGLAVSPY